MSVGNLSPSSPPTSSPPSLASSPIRAGRPPSRPRSSLVSRSRSRGRRVSFTMEDELIDVERDAGDTGVVSHGWNRRGTRHREHSNDIEPYVLKAKLQVVTISLPKRQKATERRRRSRNMYRTRKRLKGTRVPGQLRELKRPSRQSRRRRGHQNPPRPGPEADPLQLAAPIFVVLSRRNPKGSLGNRFDCLG
jgi:hypothetical protein